MTVELPKQAVTSLGLEGLTRISLEDANGSRLAPVGIDIATLDYAATSQRSDHYLLRDAPYSVVRGECQNASFVNKKPDGATHYSLGPVRDVEYVEADRNRSARFNSYVPVVFWKMS